MSQLEALSDTLSEALANAGTHEIALSRETEEFDSIAKGSRRIVIFGSGYLGKVVLAGATGAGIEVLAFADNNPSKRGRIINGVPVLTVADAVSQYGDDAVFVVGIFNSSAPRQQLRDLGCPKIVPFPMFYWRFADFFPPCGIELPHRILGHVAPMRAGFELLSDAKSRAEFAAQIRWRCTLDYECLPPASPSADTYFPPELFRLSGNEVLVDCGAFDGDSIRMFLEKCGHSFRHIYAVEPDPQNRAALEAWFASLPESQNQHISILPFAVGDRNETVSFRVTGTAGSHITSDGGMSEVECRRLDDILDGPPPTFVKMDIEGAEPKALVGAVATIRSARPILAICAYHKCDHLWTLPVLMNQALPDYKIFLRRYAEECWEMVYYAVPPERFIEQAAEPR